MTYRNERKKTKYIVITDSFTKPDENIGYKELEKQDRKEGWFGCQFHKIIKRDGKIEDGKDINQSSVMLNDRETEIKNNISISVCLIGGQSNKGKPDCNYTFKQFKSLRKLCDNLKSDYPVVECIGHRDVIDSASPSFDVSELMR
tara:strand:- start:27 stop:461 length:435 start_codon:yes stop_codon:yes gene_type:complete